MRRIAQISTDPRSRFWYLAVPEAVRRELAPIAGHLAEQGGGSADDADHVTLAFVPKADAPLGEPEVAGALEAVGRVLRGFQPFDVWVGGVAYFDTAVKDGERATALVALIDGPGLSDLHAAVARALRDHGWRWQDTHSFTAHCTLAYLPVGARVEELPVLDQAWTLNEIFFANEQIHRLPLGGATRQGALSREQIGTAIGEASMCWESPELAGVFDSERAVDIMDRLVEEQEQDRLDREMIERRMERLRERRRDPRLPMRRQADLTGENMRRFRTTPDSGYGELYSYCGGCAHVARTPITGVAGCTKGDDADVVAFSKQVAQSPGNDAQLQRCPGYMSRDESGADDEPIVRQGALTAPVEGVYTGFHGQVWEADRRDETGAITSYAFDVPTLQRWAEANTAVRYVNLDDIDLDPTQSDPHDWNTRLDMADLIYPILVVDVDGQLVIMDGVHRAFKARALGKHRIRARVIPWDTLFETGAEVEPQGEAPTEPPDPDAQPAAPPAPQTMPTTNAPQVQAGRRRVADLTAPSSAGMIKDVPGQPIEPEAPEEAPPDDLQFEGDVQPVDLSDLEDLYNYLEVVGVDPGSPSYRGLADVTRAAASWRGGLLAQALQADPDLTRRIWEGFVERATPAPAPAPTPIDADGIEQVELETPELEIEIDPEHYIWRTKRDGRVRSEHAMREGKIFVWANPPPGGHPGQEHGCRCHAESIHEMPGTRTAGRRRICLHCGLPRR